MAFNVLVSNVDDHLRNRGFLWGGRGGWRLSPAFDLNPTPVDVREHTLTTSIDVEDGTCDLALVLELAPFFGLGDQEARTLVRSVADGVVMVAVRRISRRVQVNMRSGHTARVRGGNPVIEPVRTFDELAMAQVGILRRTLTGIGEAELDWRMHPEANTIRWLLGHHLWYETWVPDAIEGTGRFLVDRKPTTLSVADVDDFWARFDAAFARRRAVYEGLEPAYLDRAFSYLGVATYTVGQLVRTHAAHFTGHTWQIRYVRGTHSRAFGTDKRVFDPF